MGLEQIIRKEKTEMFKEIFSKVDAKYYNLKIEDYKNGSILREEKSLYNANKTYKMIFDKEYSPKYLKEEIFNNIIKEKE